MVSAICRAAAVLVGASLAFLCPPALEAQRYYMDPLPVTPGQIMDDFQNDFHTADARYTGKLLLVTGRIRTVRPAQRTYDYHSDKRYGYLTMDAGQGRRPLIVYFWPWQAEQITTMKNGAVLTVMGFCQGVPPQMSLVDSCIYPSGCGGPKFDHYGPYYEIPPSPPAGGRP